MRNRRASIGLAVAAGCVMAIVFVQAAVPGQGPRQLLPDARPVAPFAAQIVAADTKKGMRYRLAFPSITENVGDGPLIVKGSRPDRSRRTMNASQVVESSDGTSRRYWGVGRLRFDRNSDHSHWHYMGFMVYELRHAQDGKLIGPDVKTGFCLGDRHRISDRPIQGAAADPRFLVNCGKSKPRLLRLSEGISVGWYDNYDAYLEGQYIDVTNVKDGLYTLVHRSNPRRLLREKTYTNNASSALIELKRKDGTDKPRVEILERCPDEKRCG